MLFFPSRQYELEILVYEKGKEYILVDSQREHQYQFLEDQVYQNTIEAAD